MTYMSFGHAFPCLGTVGMWSCLGTVASTCLCRSRIVMSWACCAWHRALSRTADTPTAELGGPCFANETVKLYGRCRLCPRSFGPVTTVWNSLKDWQLMELHEQLQIHTYEKHGLAWDEVTKMYSVDEHKEWTACWSIVNTQYVVPDLSTVQPFPDR